MIDSVQLLEQKLKQKLTNEFLDVLVEAVSVCGNGVDFVETKSFAQWCFDIAGKKCPNIKDAGY